MSNELARTPEPSNSIVATDPLAGMAQLLTDPAALAQLDDAKIQRLYDLTVRIRADKAAGEFAAAMNRVQSSMEPVRKAGFNEQTRSSFARLEDVEKMLLPVVLREGFSISCSTEPSNLNDHLRFVLLVRHNGGHSERHVLDAPIDVAGIKGTPNKTRLHGMGSTLTYCHRYLLCMVFSVQVVRDDDGNAGGAGPGGQAISDAQLAQIKAAGNEAGVDWARLYDHFKITALAELPASRFAEVVSLIARKRQLRQGGTEQ